MRTRPLVVVLALLALGCLKVDRAFASTGARRSRSDKNIAAIGHRNIVGEKSLGNWDSLDREKERGKQGAAEIERSFRILNDRALTAYVARDGDNCAGNSDSRMPIPVQLSEGEKCNAFTV